MSDMTSAVAIDLLDNLIGMVDDNQGNDYDSALHMAIDALKAQADGDTISRKATIDAMEGVDWYHIDSDGQLTHGANSKEGEPLYKAEDVYAVLNRMPSAQPEPAIPLQWIEAEIKWLKSLDNAIATSKAEDISAMVNIWKDKQDE